MGSSRFRRLEATLTRQFSGLLPGAPLIFHGHRCPLLPEALILGGSRHSPVCRLGLVKLRFAAFAGYDETFDPGGAPF